MVKIAHLSDLHFTSLDWSFSPFFSKKWLGSINFVLGRRRHFVHNRLEVLSSTFQERGISHVIITGDVTTTSSRQEFQQARSFVDALEGCGIQVFVVPGNHDQYTQEAYRNQWFYQYFPSSWERFDLRKEYMTAQQIDRKWWVVGLDNAIATHWFCSSGYFSETAQDHLVRFLESRTAEEHVLLINHFPFSRNQSRRRELRRSAQLQAIIDHFPQIKLYCCGHTHLQSLPKDSSHFPLQLNCGSTPHRHLGFWHSLELCENRCFVTVFSWQDGAWKPLQRVKYELSSS